MITTRQKGLILDDMGDAVTLRISAGNTSAWATGLLGTEGTVFSRRWPGSELSGRRLKVEFDTNGLLAYWVNGKPATAKAVLHISGDEFNACVAYFAGVMLPRVHPCRFIMVGQFNG